MLKKKTLSFILLIDSDFKQGNDMSDMNVVERWLWWGDESKTMEEWLLQKSR